MSNRELIVKWLQMPWHKQVGLLKDLGVLEQEDYKLQAVPLFRAAIKRLGQDRLLPAIEAAR